LSRPGVGELAHSRDCIVDRSRGESQSTVVRDTAQKCHLIRRNAARHRLYLDCKPLTSFQLADDVAANPPCEVDAAFVRLTFVVHRLPAVHAFAPGDARIET
jgi:hypothetical protein